MLAITTSWDDGDVLDEKLAALLDTHAIKGTFYVAQKYRAARLSEDSIRDIGLRHEVGAHTLTHPHLPELSDEMKLLEIAGSKTWLEGILGTEVSMFCYPSGHLDLSAENAVRAAGFRGARTTVQGEIMREANQFQMPTTIQVYPMPFRKRSATAYDWRNLFDPIRERWPVFRGLGVSLSSLRSWEVLACAAFDIALERGEAFHLWGHSWEIERYGMWDQLDRVLAYMANRPGCWYATNGELV